LAPSEAELIEILERTAEVTGFCGPYAPIPHLVIHVREKGLTAELAAAIRSFRERVWDQSYIVNQVSLQLFRSRLDMLAWRDEWNEIDLKRCWSEQVRADFRSMQGAERENWRRLLYSVDGDEMGRPQARWLEESAGLVSAIGPEAFRAALLRWFQPLQRGATQRLSREGSSLLRSLIWLAESLQDSELLARMDDICGVAFKPKSNGQKVVRAAAEVIGKPDPGAGPAAAVPSFHSLVARALATAFSAQGSQVSPNLNGRIQVAGETVYVRGDLDSYQVNIPTGAIFRDSDGRQLHLPATVARLGPVALPDFGGIAALFGQILILAEDAKNRSALSTGGE
jgi:hypothetical protein